MGIKLGDLAERELDVFTGGGDFKRHAPEVHVLRHHDCPSDRFIENCRCGSAMQAAGVALMIIAGNECGYDIVVFKFIEGCFQTGIVLQTAN